MIKEKLKELGIKLGDFAEILSISRPTLYSYIECFEKGEKIPKDKFQSIFEKLFSEDVKSKEQFDEILQKYEKLIERDKLLGTIDLNVENTDLMTTIIEDIKDDMNSEEFDKDMYIFINMMIKSYKREPVFKHLAKYFLVLNGQLDIDTLNDDQRVLASNCYKVFNKFKKNELTFDEGYFDIMVQRIQEIERQKKERANDINKKIKDAINEQIQLKLSLGFDIDDIDFTEVVKNIAIDK